MSSGFNPLDALDLSLLSPNCTQPKPASFAFVAQGLPSPPQPSSSSKKPAASRTPLAREESWEESREQGSTDRIPTHSPPRPTAHAGSSDHETTST